MDLPSCPICLAVIHDYDSYAIVETSCKHTFHGDCLDSWLRKDNSCPVCRKQAPATYIFRFHILNTTDIYQIKTSDPTRLTDVELSVMISRVFPDDQFGFYCSCKERATDRYAFNQRLECDFYTAVKSLEDKVDHSNKSGELCFADFEKLRNGKHYEFLKRRDFIFYDALLHAYVLSKDPLILQLSSGVYLGKYAQTELRRVSRFFCLNDDGKIGVFSQDVEDCVESPLLERPTYWYRTLKWRTDGEILRVELSL